MFEVVETSARRYPEKPAIIYYGKIVTNKGIMGKYLIICRLSQYDRH
jgi:hypothetical protein